MENINVHIANLSHEANKVIGEYARLEMCRIKNIIVKEDGHLDYLTNPDPLMKERDKYMRKMEMLLDEIKAAVEKRDGAPAAVDDEIDDE